MTLPHSPLIMGLAMGLMMPWMLHIAPEAGLGFVLAHVAVLLALASTATLLPRVRNALLSHFKRGHLAKMGGGVALGFALTCVVCLMIGGAHWTL